MNNFRTLAVISIFLGQEILIPGSSLSPKQVSGNSNGATQPSVKNMGLSGLGKLDWLITYAFREFVCVEFIQKTSGGLFTELTKVLQRNSYSC